MRTIIALAISLTIGWLCETNAKTKIQLEALKRLKDLDIESSPSLKKVVLNILESAKGKPAFVEIIRDFKLKGYEAELISYGQANANKSEGVEAMRLALTKKGLKLLSSYIGNVENKNLENTILALCLLYTSPSPRDRG